MTTSVGETDISRVILIVGDNDSLYERFHDRRWRFRRGFRSHSLCGIRGDHDCGVGSGSGAGSRANLIFDIFFLCLNGTAPSFLVGWGRPRHRVQVWLSSKTKRIKPLTRRPPGRTCTLLVRGGTRQGHGGETTAHTVPRTFAGSRTSGHHGLDFSQPGGSDAFASLSQLTRCRRKSNGGCRASALRRGALATP